MPRLLSTLAVAAAAVAVALALVWRRLSGNVPPVDLAKLYPKALERGKTCRTVAPELEPLSVEDFRPISSSYLIAAGGDVLFGANFGTVKREGTLWLVDMYSDRVRQLTLENFPANDKFRPHGLDYDEKRARLFVVNHTPQGDRIDAFDVKDVSWGFNSVRAVYVDSVAVTSAPEWAMNSVSAVDDDNIYVTQWLPAGIAPDGLEGKSFLAKVRALRNFGAWAMAIARNSPENTGTGVHRCSLTTKKCEQVNNIFASSNGIARDPTGSFVFVVDCIIPYLSTFRRDAQTGKLSLLARQRLAFNPDNIIPATSGYSDGKVRLHVGTIPDARDYIAHAIKHLSLIHI